MRISSALCLLCLSVLGTESAFAETKGELAIKSSGHRSTRTERIILRCAERFQGREAIGCLSSAITYFAADVGSCGDIRAIAPRAFLIIETASVEIKRARTKEAAISVLNKATSLLRSLAAESKAEAQSVYSRINRAFETAINVIESKVPVNLSLAAADGPDGTWFGEINCPKLSFAGPLKSTVDITIAGTSGKLFRELLSYETAAIVGREEGEGQSASTGAIRISSVWKPTDLKSKFASTSTYSGVLIGRSGTLEGAQTWTADGKMESRNCTVMLSR